MSNRWIMAVAAGAAVSMWAPGQAEAQGNSQAARARQQAEQERRASTRDAQRRAVEANRDARGASERRDERARSDARSASERERESERERLRLNQERERLQADRRRQAELDRITAERRRQAEYDRLAVERRRQAEYDRMMAERRRQAELERMRRLSWDRYQWDNHRDWKGSGPAFCRSGGAGHPVFGRQWCQDKGFGSRYDRWDRDGWRNVDVQRRRGRDYDLGRPVLIDILGDVLYRRFEAFGRQYYGGGALTGDWFHDGRGGVLQLSVGGVPFARLVDANRNGRIDDVLLRR